MIQKSKRLFPESTLLEKNKENKRKRKSVKKTRGWEYDLDAARDAALAALPAGTADIGRPKPPAGRWGR